MRAKKHQPWLSPTGVEISTEHLKEICKSWGRRTWNDYLKWYESSRREALVSPLIYEKKGEELDRSIFETFNQESSIARTEFCESLLTSLPTREEKVLRLVFFEGRTEREIAAHLGVSAGSAHKIKTRALLRLKQGHPGDEGSTRRLMRGDSENVQAPAFWTAPLFTHQREDDVYDPKNYKQELKEIKNQSLKAAVSDLSERQQQILFLRFWCDYSFEKIARELKVGVNFAEQICEAAVAKLKRALVFNESDQNEGGPSCA